MTHYRDTYPIFHPNTEHFFLYIPITEERARVLAYTHVKRYDGWDTVENAIERSRSCTISHVFPCNQRCRVAVRDYPIFTVPWSIEVVFDGVPTVVSFNMSIGEVHVLFPPL